MNQTRRGMSVVPELPGNKKENKEQNCRTSDAQRVHRVISHGTPSRRCAFLRGQHAAIDCSGIAPKLCQGTHLHCAAGSTGRLSFPIGGRVAPPYKHNVDVHGSKCFLPPPATTEAKISCDVFFFFWASRRHVRWPCVHYRILATASSSIGGDTAAILLTGVFGEPLEERIANGYERHRRHSEDPLHSEKERKKE